MTIADILRDSNYKLTQFSLVDVQNLESRIKIKTVKGKEIPEVECLVRKKVIKLTPEETVRQLYVQVLKNEYGYPTERMELEYGVTFGREKKRADIVIFDKQQTTSPYIIVELKKPKLKDGKEQLKSYCNATGAPIEFGVTAIPFLITTGKILIISRICLLYRGRIRNSPIFFQNAGQSMI